MHKAYSDNNLTLGKDRSLTTELLQHLQQINYKEMRQTKYQNLHKSEHSAKLLKHHLHM
jgi:hypothetical protein